MNKIIFLVAMLIVLNSTLTITAQTEVKKQIVPGEQALLPIRDRRISADLDQLLVQRDRRGNKHL